MLKVKIFLVSLIFLYVQNVFCQQFEFLDGEDITVIEEGSALPDPFSGGFNAVQVHHLDIDLDGEEDWIIFDRSANKAYMGAREGEHIRIDLDKTELLPPEISNWLVFADYDGDGRPDIFTDTSFGVRVIRNGEESWEFIEGNLQAESRGNLVNIVVSGSDYPAIGDFDEDGDTDLMVFDFVSGDRIVFYKNISRETGAQDPLLFEKSDLFWGQIEECFCNDFVFDENGCDPERAQKTEHAASKSITFYKNDLLIGVEDCPELAYLPNSAGFDNKKFDSFRTDFFPKMDFGNYAVTTYGDVDNDGTDDFIVSSNLRTDGFLQDYSNSINVFSGNDRSVISENFLQGSAIDVGEQSYPVLQDIDNDGDLDLFIGNSGRFFGGSYKSTVSYYENTGTPRRPEFTLIERDFAGLATLEHIKINLSFHEINGDGLTDLVFSAAKKELNRGDVYVMLQNEDFTYGEPQSWGFRYSRNDLPIIRDINADGRLDILLCQNFGRISTFLNLGSNTEPDFSEQPDFFLDIDSDGSRLNPTLAFANVDDDSAPEVLKSDSRGVIEVYQPETTEPFGQNYLNRFTGELSRFDLGFNNPMTFGDLYGNGELFGFIGDIRGGLKVIRLVSTDRQENSGGIIAYPNPVFDRNDVFLYAEKTQKVSVYDAAGRKVVKDFMLYAEEEQTMNIATLNPGVYFLKGSNNVFRLVKR